MERRWNGCYKMFSSCRSINGGIFAILLQKWMYLRYQMDSIGIYILYIIIYIYILFYIYYIASKLFQLDVFQIKFLPSRRLWGLLIRSGHIGQGASDFPRWPIAWITPVGSLERNDPWVDHFEFFSRWNEGLEGWLKAAKNDVFRIHSQHFLMAPWKSRCSIGSRIPAQMGLVKNPYTLHFVWSTSYFCCWTPHFMVDIW